MKVAIIGTKRSNPYSMSNNGELDEMIGIRHKDGTFRPIPDYKKIFEGLGYESIFVHSNSGYKHFLGLKANGTFEWFSSENNGTIVPNQTITVITTLQEAPTFTQIGNVININDSNGLKYAIWYENAYKLINSNFDGAQSDTELLGRVSLKVDGVTNAQGVRETMVYASETEFKYSSYADAITNEVNLKTRIDSAKGLLAKSATIESQDGFLSGYLMACTAIQLYDGTYILHSNPILLGQPFDIATRYTDLIIAGRGYSYKNSPVTFYKNYCSYGFSNDEKKRVAIYSSAINAYSGENTQTPYVNTSNYPSLIASFDNWINSSFSHPVVSCVSRNRIKYKIESTIDQSLKPLVSSICVFITNQVHLYDFDNISKLKSVFLGKEGGLDHYLENYSGKVKDNSQLQKELSELKTFYKVKTIDFDEIKTTTTNGGWIDIDLSDGILENLASQEPLSYDDFSHHQLLPEIQFVYNSKLHIGNYKTVFSHGFPLKHFYANQGVGQFQSSYNTTGLFWWIKVKIKTLYGTSEVVRYKPYMGTQAENIALGCMLSYPDSRAYEMTLYLFDVVSYSAGYGYLGQKTVPLKALDGQNVAYYIDPDLKPISMYMSTGNGYSYVIPPELNREQISSNIARVSEINNPFTFPIENTYSIGNGQITAFATNTIALSTGQAGQFPLYVFCTDGIYAMFIGGAEVNYASSRPISREVCNNPLSVTPIDTGVVFTTEKGLMILSGSSAEEIAAGMEGNHFDVTKLDLFHNSIQNDGMVQLSNEITTESFLDYISQAKIGYNYPDKELWITNPNKTYSYVLAKGIWFKVKTSGSSFIGDYPKQYLLKDGDVYDLSSEEGTAKEIMILTRPIIIGDSRKKQEIRVIVRGKFDIQNLYVNNVFNKYRYLGLYVYGSNDAEAWKLLGGMTKIKSFNDIGVQIKRTDCKYIRIGLIGNLKLNSEIDYIEIEAK